MQNKHILEEPVASTVISHRFSYVVWSSIFAAVFVAMVSQLTLSLLCSSIGLSLLNVTEGNNLKALSTGGAIWWIISGCISSYIGGLVAGRMSGIPRQVDGMYHGIISFCVGTVFLFFLLTSSLGTLIAGGFNMLGSGARSALDQAPQIAAGASILPQGFIGNTQNIQNDLKQTLDRIQDPVKKDELKRSLLGLSTAENPNMEKQRISTLLLQSANMNQNEAQNKVNQWSQDINSIKNGIQYAEQKVGESAQTASRAVGGMAFASFIMLILGAFFAGWGGKVGAPHWTDQEIV